MTSADQFLPPPPPAVGSAAYAAAFNEVKSLGAANSTTRTADETLYAHFWADVPGHSVTPPGHWDEIAEHVSLQEGLNLEQNAHLFALLNIGLADEGINCWDAKYIYNYWRPITAIRDPRASQINPDNTSDPNWTPLWNTPNFPGYASGHSTFSGAASVILASIFGDNTSFMIGSDDMPGYSRSYTSFSQAADEAGESRVVGGIHFSFDNVAGLNAGRELGNFIAQNFLLPRREHHYQDDGWANHQDDHGHQTDALIQLQGNRDGALFSTRSGEGMTQQDEDWLLPSFAHQPNATVRDRVEQVSFSAQPEGEVQFAMKMAGRASRRYIGRYVQPSEEQTEVALGSLF
jgi:hypothetical protein